MEVYFNGAGVGMMISRVLDLLVIRTVRPRADAYVDANKCVDAFIDARIGRELNKIHAYPTHNWNLAELISFAGSSRPVIGERFAAMVSDTSYNIRYDSETGLVGRSRSVFGYPPSVELR